MKYNGSYYNRYGMPCGYNLGDEIRDGENYGDLTVIGKRDHHWFYCLCKCGNRRDVRENKLLSGKIGTCLKCEIADKQARI